MLLSQTVAYLSCKPLYLCSWETRSLCVHRYLGLAVVGELGSHGAMLPWFLLVMFLPLPFAIWLSIVLAGIAVSDCGFSVLQACISVLLGVTFSEMPCIWLVPRSTDTEV